MRRVRSVGIASLRAEGIAASAASDYAAQRAAQPLWEGTTATTVGRLSSPKPPSESVTCVYSFCLCSVVYVILICDRHHTTGQLSPMLFVP